MAILHSSAAQEREFAFSDRDFRFLSQLANEKTGIQLPEHKRDMVYARVSRRIRALGMNSFTQYCELLTSPAADEEITHLINAITTNLTHFFREKHHFDHLRQQVLMPALQRRDRRIRIWSAGCSSGMEPYSIAMTVRSMTEQLASWDVKILATDIDTNMLARGQRGEYPAEEFANIPAALRGDVIAPKAQGPMQMKDVLRQMVAFKPLNLLQPWPMKGPFDAIFCRNVVIYFDKPTQQTLFARMAKLLRPEGFLYIGHSENITRISTEFDLVGKTIYRLKGGA